MHKFTALAVTALAVLGACTSAPVTTGKPKPPTAQEQQSFEAFYKQLRKDIAARGYSADKLDAAFGGAPQPIPSVITSEKSQPELTRTFSAYVGSMLTTTRIGKGLENIEEHRAALQRISRESGVPGGVIVALWGIESNFGARQGENPILPSLVTLAWKSPRADYFRKEVFDAMEVLRRTGMQPQDLKGSWAGAMGQCQFMPSSYLAYARDGDGDGKADIWKNEEDVFASAANYLKSRGWKAGQPWRVQLAGAPNMENVKVNARGLSDHLTLAEWKKRGAKFAVPEAGKSFPAATRMRAYEPQPGGPVYLLGPNFDVILKWNNSSYFAYSVLSLADVLQTEGKL